MRKVVLLAAALVVALGIGAVECHVGRDGDGRHRADGHDRGHLPADGAGVALRDDPRPR